MSAVLSQSQAFTLKDLMRSGIGVPLGVMAVLAMVVLPMPPLVLDMLFTFNIALSLVVVMAVFYVARPLEFGVFPTVLLLATLLRLALNVASTRVVLLHGHTGSGAAGKVIESFGEFVIGGNYAVGIVVFMILTIINFVVVTKGAGRISEVSARFTLDAMPGKQMAIDADLNAGLITQEQARTRRQEVRDEADFYGSMDGASKFVRGDATAGILILFINIIGGLAIGMMSHGMDFSACGQELCAADHRRRPGGADSRAAAVHRGGHHRHPHVACSGHGRRTGPAAVRPAQGSRGCGIPAGHHGPDPGHAEHGFPASVPRCAAVWPGVFIPRPVVAAGQCRSRKPAPCRRLRRRIGNCPGTTCSRWT